MKPHDLEGVFGPVVTTFNARTGDLDLAAFGSNVRAHLAAGVCGIVVCGSTGEAALVSEEERLELLERARRDVPMGKCLLMGTGAESTRLTVRRCREAQTVGADAVLVVAPHYYANAMTPATLRTHYRRVADESPLPLVLYNIPKYMHFKLSPDLVADLAGHQNIIGIKDSSGDLDLLGGYLRSQSSTFTVLTGSGGQLHAALMAGARGAILAVSLFAAETSVRIFTLHGKGEHTAADQVQSSLKPLATTIVAELGVPGVKAAMDAAGLCGGRVRAPLLDLDASDRERVSALVASLGAAAA